MKKKLVCIFLAALGMGALVIRGQIKGTIVGGQRATIAVPDFRGVGEAQAFMGVFNATLWDLLSGSGKLTMAPKRFYPLEVPQRPDDFKPPGKAQMKDWAAPPVKADDLAFGYTYAQDGKLMLRGWLYNLSSNDPANAQVIGKVYLGTVDAEGAKKIASEFAADILENFGAKSLSGTRIYFVSDRTGSKEIWSMDYDGSNQRALTQYKSVSTMPAISADAKLFAFTTYAQGNPKIMVYSAENERRLPFINPVSSAVETPEFTPDGKRIMFAASLEGWVQLCIADVNGGGMRRISHVRAIEVSPKINPKNANEVVFISGRGGSEQLWKMNIDGSNLEMLTSGQGYVANPSWSPDGQFIAFAWTLGYEPGNYNIFIMDAATKKIATQLTHGSGRNENPVWAPDGAHIVFSSKRGRATQLYTMLADGTNVQQLTTQGNNLQPVWSKSLN